MNNLKRKVGLMVLILSSALLSTACATSETRVDNRDRKIYIPRNYTESDRMALASSAYRQKHYKRAISIYRDLINANENNHKATLNLSAVYFDMALEGFKHVGALVSDEADASEALEYYEGIQHEVSGFMEVAKRHVVQTLPNDNAKTQE